MKTVTKIIGLLALMAATSQSYAFENDLKNKTLNMPKDGMGYQIQAAAGGGGSSGGIGNPSAGGIVTPETPQIFEDVTKAYRDVYLPTPQQVTVFLKPNYVEINGPHVDMFDTISDAYKKHFYEITPIKPN